MRQVLGLSLFAIAIGLSAPVRAADMPEPISDVTFQCNLGRTIHAAFYPDRVDLALSDGRTLTLPQAMSGSGARYANADESLVFWNKGNTAFMTEGAGGPETYSGCIVLNSAAPADWLAFASSEFGFSLRYPPGYTVDGGYVYDGLGPGHDITGVSFTIPAALTAGTNLDADTRLSVEALADAPACTADRFLPPGADAPTSVSDGGVDYSVASQSEGGAGNIWETTVHALVGTSPCLAVRYFFHSHNAANFDPPVAEFDKAALTATFDAIRRTLVIGR